MKVALFGGSFDPIHRGHIDTVLDARHQLGLDRVVFLPTAQPPHKPERRFAPALARYCMVEMALLEYTDLHVSAYELTLGRAAYTIETIEHFRAEWPDDELLLLIGADSFRELDQWHRWTEILAAVPVVVLVRPGYDPGVEGLGEQLRELAQRHRVRFCENRPVDVSSTDIRADLRAGHRPPEQSLPRAVLDFCLKYRLYR